MNTTGSTQEERTGATITYVLMAILGWLGGLIGWLIWRDKGSFAKDQTTEALNFGITTLIGLVLSYIISQMIPGLHFLHSLIWLLQLVFSVLAAVAANQGRLYRFPFALRLIH